jgi:prepilin-type N-terminal cleavage/methylation domain-containing protein
MKMNKKGFTLIELLIVVAIIAILAAIAIPQFSQYRIKGYNSAATADLRNGRTAEEAFFSDWQAYASTVANAVGGNGAAQDASFFNGGAFTIAATSINGTAPSADTTFVTGVSQNVKIFVHTDAGGQSFAMATKNASGDRCYGMDSDVTSVYWVNGPIADALDAAAIAASVGGADDLLGVAGGASCDGNPTGTGQLAWVAL